MPQVVGARFLRLAPQIVATASISTNKSCRHTSAITQSFGNAGICNCLVARSHASHAARFLQNSVAEVMLRKLPPCVSKIAAMLITVSRL